MARPSFRAEKMKRRKRFDVSDDEVPVRGSARCGALRRGAARHGAAARPQVCDEVGSSLHSYHALHQFSIASSGEKRLS